MTFFIPLLEASIVIQLHVVTALVAVVLAPVNLLRQKRDHLHRRLGYIWVVAMALCALSSFWINGIGWVGPFGPIHLLSVLTLYTLWRGIQHARRGQIEAHRATFRGLSLYALVGAGSFVFLPGRLLNDVFFRAVPEIGYAVPVLAGIVVGARLSLGGVRGKITTKG